MLGRTLASRQFKDLFNRSQRLGNKKYAIMKNDESDLRTLFYDLGVREILQRLKSVRGRAFRNVAFIGPLAEEFWKDAAAHCGVEAITVVDDVKESVDRSVARIKSQSPSARVVGLTLSESDLWSFPEGYFHLIVNNHQLHWTNNVHEALLRWQKSLVPDGALIGACLGGDTLQELRIALSLAEQEREGGISSHVSPMLMVTDVGNSLGRTNYQLVTASADVNTLYFDDMFSLMSFLQSVGESNAVVERREVLSKHTFIAAAAIYKHLFALREGQWVDKIPATFDVVHYIGWREHESQQKPLKPGTKGLNLKQLAEEVQDPDIELGELLEKDGSVKVKYLRSKDKPSTS